MYYESNILDWISTRIQRWRSAQSIEHALKQLFPPRVLRRILSDVESADMVDIVSRHYGWPSELLLERVAIQLSLRSTNDIAALDGKLLNMIGISPEKLKASMAVMQRSEISRTGYALVIADPERIDLAAFKQLGVPLFLGSGRAVREAWQKFEWSRKQIRANISEAQLLAVLVQLSVDAQRCGAHEVFIGHPKEDSYEFLAGTSRFSGKLHQRLYSAIIEQFHQVPRRTYVCESANEIKSISIALTRNFERPVVCLTWDAMNEYAGPLDYDRSGNDAAPASVKEPPHADPDPKPANIVTSGNPVVVYLIDDDQRFLLILSRILEAKGWQVYKFESAYSVLELINNGKCHADLIISDVHMPGMDGTRLLRSIRQRNLGIPVLMLTSDEEDLLEAELALLGADAFVRKQEDPRILVAWCSNLVNRGLNSTKTIVSPDINRVMPVINGILQ